MDDYIKKYFAVLIFLVMLPSTLMAAPLWSDVAISQTSATFQAKQLSPNKNSRHVSVSFDQLKATLASAATLPVGQAAKTVFTTQIDLPMPYGGLQTFNVYQSSVMAPELAAKYPEIQSYKVVAVNDPGITGVLDTGPKGFHAYLNTAEGEMFIDPVSSSTQQEYYSLYKHDYASTSRKFSCGVKSKSVTASPVEEFMPKGIAALARTSDTIKTYRIAVATTGEYSQAVKASPSINVKAEALAEVVKAIARVSFIYERDLAIKLELVATNDNIIFTDAATDPYTNNDPAALLTENQSTLDSLSPLLIGSANYDLGHVFSTGGGGLASLSSVCVDGFKARGETGRADPLVGDLFYIDYVAHEIGHQLGANHSFNGTSGSCGSGNRNAATAFEPGSGSTIMGYAGICSPENSTTASIAAFHAGSIEEIVNNTTGIGTGAACGALLMGQAAPTVDPVASRTIPGGTAFTLTGSATDADTALNNLTYQWDQMDVGVATTAATYGTDITTNTLFRSFLPDASPVRIFPQLSTLMSNVVDKAETLPLENRTLNFRFTVRDGLGGVDKADVQVVVDGSKGPFEVLQPNTSVIVDSSQPQSVQWNAACTESAPVSCANVDVLMTTDGGTTFTSIVGGSTPNDGVAEVDFGGVVAANTRVKVACLDNVFFDISNVDFELANGSGSILPATEIGGSYNCGTATGNVVVTDGNDTLPEADSLTLPANLSGTVNDILDPDDIFVFVASATSYTITLSNYANNDLDLYLLNSSGAILSASESWTSPTEIITHTPFVVGNTYYVVAHGFDTVGQDSPYTLVVQEGVVLSGGGGGTLSYYWLFMLLMTPLLRLRQKD